VPPDSILKLVRGGKNPIAALIKLILSLIKVRPLPDNLEIAAQFLVIDRNPLRDFHELGGSIGGAHGTAMRRLIIVAAELLVAARSFARLRPHESHTGGSVAIRDRLLFVTPNQRRGSQKESNETLLGNPHGTPPRWELFTELPK
jgi:hypothetical protein